MRRGEIWWASLPEPSGSRPGYRRPVVLIQSDVFTASRIRTVLAATLTSNVKLAQAPGNVLLPKERTGLQRDAILNVSQLITLDKALLTERIGKLRPKHLQELEAGLRLVLAL